MKIKEQPDGLPSRSRELRKFREFHEFRESAFREEGEQRFRREAEQFSAEPGMVFAMPGMFSTGMRRWTSLTATMNPPREDQSAGEEIVHAEITGGFTPPIRTQTGLPADRAKLLDRRE